MSFNDDARADEVRQLEQTIRQVSIRLTALAQRQSWVEVALSKVAIQVAQLEDLVAQLGPILGPNDQIRVRIPGPEDTDPWPTVVDDAGVEHTVKCQADLDRIVQANPELAKIVGAAKEWFPAYND